MRKLSISGIAFMLFIICSNCSKDSTNTVSVPQETISVIIGTSQININAKASMAFRIYKDSTGKTTPYFSLSITPKTNEIPKLNIEIYKSKITNTTYNLPLYFKTSELNPVTGYANSTYTTSDASYIVNGVNSKGNVTIFTIDSTKLTGNYDVTLVNKLDYTQKINIKGEFNLKLYNTAK
jgi:hypothetical protein